MTDTPAPAEALSREQLEALKGHTPGPWYGEDSPMFWQLFARQICPVDALVDPAVKEIFPNGMEVHPLQLLKAPKGGTPYAEYWPDEADARLIAAAPDLLTTALAALARAEAAEAEVKRLREGAARYLAVQLDFDGLDVQEVHAFTTPEERLAFMRQQANDPELGRPERATKRGILWDYSGYRTALFPVDAPALAGSPS